MDERRSVKPTREQRGSIPRTPTQRLLKKLVERYERDGRDMSRIVYVTKDQFRDLYQDVEQNQDDTWYYPRYSLSVLTDFGWIKVTTEPTI